MNRLIGKSLTRRGVLGAGLATAGVLAMGADDRTVLKTVVLPLILPYLVSGYAFAFVLSLNEYIVAYMGAGLRRGALHLPHAADCRRRGAFQ